MMVGREEELAQLQSWYAQVLEGQRRVVFVAGEAGIGKTTFVRASSIHLSKSAGAHRARAVCRAIRRGRAVHAGARGAEPTQPGTRRRARGRAPDKFAPTWLAQMPALLRPEERERLQDETKV